MTELKNISKTFNTPRGKITVLDDFSLSVNDGTFLGIKGKSGAGKSTLLSIIAGLQRPSSGKVLLSDQKGNLTDIFTLNDSELSEFRNKNTGFVSQEQSFLENLNVFDNVRLPYFLGLKTKPSKDQTDFINERVLEILESLEISHLAESWPRDLSGGENHRVLIARALINNPRLILADEPTESVDSRQSEQIISIFRSLSDRGKTVILVSHDEKVLKKCDRVITIES